MNRFEEYFKNKINWKLFNMLLDACTELEDESIWFSLDVSIINDKSITNSGKYLFIYRYYTVLGGAANSSIKEYSKVDFMIGDSIASYNKNGLFYVLTLDNNNDKTAATLSKIRSNKYFREIDNDSLMKSFRFIFQAI